MGKILDHLQDETFRYSISFYKKWRQTVRNGVLPIGASNVGKTTLLSRLDVEGANLFMNFNRTTKTRTDTLKLRSDFIKVENDAEYIKKIDVPGDLPKEWATAYFNNNPRVLVIMVDDRDPSEHSIRISEFLNQLRIGANFWQKTKSTITFNRNNLARIIFIINKADKIDPQNLIGIDQMYSGILADVHEFFNVNIQTFKISLTGNDANLESFFLSVLDSFSRK